MTISFSDRVEVPKHVLVRFLDNESVFLNLETEHYYGLDEIGTRIWQAVAAAPYIEAAYEQLLSQFDVEAQHFRQNFSELLERLVNDGLLRVRCTNAGMDPANLALERPARRFFLRASAGVARHLSQLAVARIARQRRRSSISFLFDPDRKMLTHTSAPV